MTTVPAATDSASPLAPRAEPAAPVETRSDERPDFSTTLAAAHTRETRPRNTSPGRRENGPRDRRADDAASSDAPASVGRSVQTQSRATAETVATLHPPGSTTRRHATRSLAASNEDGASDSVTSTDGATGDAAATSTNRAAAASTDGAAAMAASNRDLASAAAGSPNGGGGETAAVAVTIAGTHAPKDASAARLGTTSDPAGVASASRARTVVEPNAASAPADAPRADAAVGGDPDGRSATEHAAQDASPQRAAAGTTAAPAETHDARAAHGVRTAPDGGDTETAVTPSSDDAVSSSGGAHDAHAAPHETTGQRVAQEPHAATTPNASASDAADGATAASRARTSDASASTDASASSDASGSSDASASSEGAPKAGPDGALRSDAEPRSAAGVVTLPSQADRHVDATERATNPRHTAAGTYAGHHRGVVDAIDAQVGGQGGSPGTTDRRGGGTTAGEDHRDDGVHTDRARDALVEGAGTEDGLSASHDEGSLSRLTTGVGSETAASSVARSVDTTVAGGNAGAHAPVSPPSGDGATTAPATHAEAASGARRGADASISPWAERVVESVRVATLRGGGEMRLHLEPAGLGHIDVRITLAHDGIHASIVAEHDSTRALLRNEQHLLHAALERSDMHLAGFSVDLGSGGSSSAFADAERGGAGLAREAAASPEPETIVASEICQPPVEPGHLSVRV